MQVQPGLGGAGGAEEVATLRVVTADAQPDRPEGPARPGAEARAQHRSLAMLGVGGVDDELTG